MFRAFKDSPLQHGLLAESYLRMAAEKYDRLPIDTRGRQGRNCVSLLTRRCLYRLRESSGILRNEVSWLVQSFQLLPLLFWLEHLLHSRLAVNVQAPSHERGNPQNIEKKSAILTITQVVNQQ